MPPASRTRLLRASVFAVLVVASGAPRAAAAQSVQGEEPPAVEQAPKPTPAQKRGGYSLPFALRPAVAPNLVRLDTAVVPQSAATTIATVLTAGYKPIAAAPDLGFYVRGALVHQAPGASSSGTGVSNPLFFALYTPEVAKSVRVAAFLGVTAPIGTGGGASASPVERGTIAAGVYARQAMDNALFATNYVTPTAGIGLAYVDAGLTLQAEATLLQLVRTRGDAVEKDAARTNFTAGVHAGYRVLPALTVSLEAHHQHWLSTPAAVAANAALRSQTTAGAGVRLNLPVSETVLVRPGLAYFQGLDDPMDAAGHRVIVLDVPVAF